MTSYIRKLGNRISPPKWLVSNIMYEGVTGSTAYGVSSNSSDLDIIGFCIPPKEIIFPHLTGEIFGFGTQIKRFDQYEQQHINVLEWNQNFDINIYSIVKFFQLTMENNPNMLDALFLPRNCVVHSTAISEHVRNNRKLFLHKGCWPKFRGYAYAQLSKIKNKSNSTNSVRNNYINQYGYDVKFAYHVVRLLLEVEQILIEENLDLQKNSKILKTVRNGEWSIEKLMDWANEKEKQLENIFANSNLRNIPNESKIKELLIDCLSMHYGDISNLIPTPKDNSLLLYDLKNLIQKYD